MKNGFIKNKKGYKLTDIMKKVAAGLLIGGVAIGGILGFVGCNKNKQQQVQEPPAIIEPGPGTDIEPENPNPPIVEESTTYAEFIGEYLDEAQDFVLTYIAPKVFTDKEILSQEFYVKGNNDNLTAVDVLYTYAKDDQTRVLEQATVGLRHPIDYDDILEGNVTLPSNDVEVFRTQIMDFDAKLNKTSPELVNALYAAAEKPNEDVKLFKEIKSSLDGYRMFDIFTMDGKDVNILEFGVVAGASDEEMLKNLSNPMALTNVMTKKYTLDGGYVYGEEYDLSEEDFEQEVEPGPGGEHEQQPGGEHEQDPEKEVTAQEVIDALNKNCREGAINKAFTDVLTPKLEKVENENYYINEKDGKIVSVDYTFNYKQTSTSNYFIANTITFNTPITREDLKNGNISKAKFETKYIVNYNPTIQEKNKSLTNAIFTALGIEDTGATRILVEKSKGGVGDADFGQYNSYKVVEISDNEIKEYDVTVKYSENIIEQIQQGNIRKDSEKSTLTEGDKLTAETTNEKESSAATVYYDNNGWKISLDGEEFTL